MTTFLTQFKRFATLVLPTLLLAVLLAFGFNQYQIEVHGWLSDVKWLSFLALAVAAIVAWQFGRSRLVFACFFLLLFVEQPWIALPENWPRVSFFWVALGTLVLLFSKDRGFSLRNSFMTIGIIGILGLLSWLVTNQLNQLSDAQLLQALPQLGYFPESLKRLASLADWLFLIALFILATSRLLFRLDNSHNALYFLFLANGLMYLLADSSVNQVVVLALSGLIGYSVLKDSFTMAFKDELTGVPSRRALMQFVHTLGRKYVVVMSDIDHFKKFNDTYGHDVGDEVLKLVASKLARVKGGGNTFRFGGEEFVMVFPNKTPEQVVPYVEQVREIIANYEIALREQQRKTKSSKNRGSGATKKAAQNIVKVTSSFGIAQRTAEDQSFERVMKQADVALYAAKKAGRNCVKVAKQA